jgi:hypothetical protein
MIFNYIKYMIYMIYYKNKKYNSNTLYNIIIIKKNKNFTFKQSIKKIINNNYNKK